MLRAYDKASGKEVGDGDDARAAERIADDVHGRNGQAVHRDRSQRRRLFRRVPGVHLPAAE